MSDGRWTITGMGMGWERGWATCVVMDWLPTLPPVNTRHFILKMKYNKNVLTNQHSFVIHDTLEHKLLLFRAPLSTKSTLLKLDDVFIFTLIAVIKDKPLLNINYSLLIMLLFTGLPRQQFLSLILFLYNNTPSM